MLGNKAVPPLDSIEVVEEDPSRLTIINPLIKAEREGRLGRDAACVGALVETQRDQRLPPPSGRGQSEGPR